MELNFLMWLSHSYFPPKSFHFIGSFVPLQGFFIHSISIFLSFYVIIQRLRNVLFIEYFHNNQKTLGILKYGQISLDLR